MLVYIERWIYETFGGRGTIIKNLMKQFDSDGDLLNANGVAGMDVTGKGTSWQQLTSVSEEYRQKMFDNVKREFIQENGLLNGDTTKRSDIFKDYQLSVSKDKRLSGTWTLEQYEVKKGEITRVLKKEPLIPAIITKYLSLFRIWTRKFITGVQKMRKKSGNRILPL